MYKVCLFENKSECCACQACENVCTQNAISMVNDEYGFAYPVIDNKKCIGCNQCINVCEYKKSTFEHEPMSSYVAVVKDEKLRLKSASGGVFSAISLSILKNKGVVYGCAMDNSNNGIYARHICVDDVEQLYKLQGSKYVQSVMGDIYKQVKVNLQENKVVLFSGTPCQIGSLKSYLGKDYDNLLLVDIICHGTPSTSFFQGYIQEFEKRLGGKIIDFNFRDKTTGWGHKAKVIYVTKKGNMKQKMISVSNSSYFKLFLDAEINRENCYSCQYASSSRPGDITIGDYWGIENEHPEYLTIHGGDLDVSKGISCLLINSKKGEKFIENYGEKLVLGKSSFEQISRGNDQLNRPSQLGANRKIILENYRTDGYRAVEKWFSKKIGLKKYIYIIWDTLPAYTQKGLKRLREIF